MIENHWFVGSSPISPTNQGSKMSKPIKLINIKTKEVWFCKNLNEVKLIDGTEFITVSRKEIGPGFFMKKDQFEKA